MSGWIEEELNRRRQQGLYRRRRPLEPGQGSRVYLAGRELVSFCSNDYLGLARDPRLARAAARAARRYGCGAGASPLVAGFLPPLRALECQLARWEETEAALVFSSGFAANLATIAGLAGPGDVIFSDAWNHASLIDGCRLARAAVHVYHHSDLDHLHRLLQAERGRGRRAIIVTDSVFSMDGDRAPLASLLELAGRFDCLLLLDEAHATGVLGEQGRGVTDLLPPEQGGRERLIKVGTLSKALGAQGGFVCGSRSLVRWLINQARPYIYSTALTPPAAAAAGQAVKLVVAEPERRRRLLELAGHLHQELRGRGHEVAGSACQILPVLVGDSRAAVRLSRRLQEQGVLVPAIRPPSVPTGTARLRISLTAAHTPEDVELLLAALERA